MAAQLLVNHVAPSPSLPSSQQEPPYRLFTLPPSLTATLQGHSSSTEVPNTSSVESRSPTAELGEHETDLILAVKEHVARCRCHSRI